jgi:hypothetical protein
MLYLNQNFLVGFYAGTEMIRVQLMIILHISERILRGYEHARGFCCLGSW